MVLGLGGTELMVIGGAFVLLFGAGSIIRWARALGKAKKEFVKAQEEFENPTEEKQ